MFVEKCKRYIVCPSSMTSTIETNNINILKKVGYLTEICNFLHDKVALGAANTATFTMPSTVFEKIYAKIDNFVDYYSVESVSILSDYFILINSSGAAQNDVLSKQKDQYTKKYHQFIKSNNIPQKIDAIYNELKEIFIEHIFNPSQVTKNEIGDMSAVLSSVNIYQTDDIMICVDNVVSPTHINTDKTCKDAWVLFNKYRKIKIHIQIEEVKISNICGACNEHMMITSTNEQSCSRCGKCQEASIIIIDDDNAIFDSKNIKYGTYDPSKHCKYWIDRIQGREISDMTEIYKTAKQIQTILQKGRIKNVDYITCELIRSYLRKNNKSTMNEHVPLIRKIITGIAPPQLTEQELQRLNIYFIKVIKIYNAIKPSNKINCPYHPYIIFKILEQMLIDGSRKTAILKCIHLQSAQTLIWNDKIWYGICEVIRINDVHFKYIATDRNR